MELGFGDFGEVLLGEALDDGLGLLLGLDEDMAGADLLLHGGGGDLLVVLGLDGLVGQALVDLAGDEGLGEGRAAHGVEAALGLGLVAELGLFGGGGEDRLGDDLVLEAFIDLVGGQSGELRVQARESQSQIAQLDVMTADGGDDAVAVEGLQRLVDLRLKIGGGGGVLSEARAAEKGEDRSRHKKLSDHGCSAGSIFIFARLCAAPSAISAPRDDRARG